MAAKCVKELKENNLRSNSSNEGTTRCQLNVIVLITPAPYSMLFSPVTNREHAVYTSFIFVPPKKKKKLIAYLKSSRMMISLSF